MNLYLTVKVIQKQFLLMQGGDNNHALKKSILWNVVEPGDPYDIRKSMIARLPGDKKTFMGNRLELVCLLQAAQIERLSLTLEDYRIKYRQIERHQLDRHSYEVQIRQLAAKAQQQQQLRVQNGKLKNFIDRLNRELQDLHSKNTSSNQLGAKYQQALAQVQSLGEQLTQMKMESNGLRQTVSFKTNQLVQTQRLVRQLQEKVDAMKEDSHLVENYQEKFALLGEEISRLNSVLKTKAEESLRLGERLKKSEEELRLQREQNGSLRANSYEINEQIQSLKFLLQRMKNDREEVKVNQYESQLRDANAECERLLISLRKCELQNQELCVQIKRYEDKHTEMTTQLTDKQRMLLEFQQEQRKYEGNTTMITHELQRLNSVLKGKIDEINTMQLKCNRLTEQNQFYITQIDGLQREVQQLKERYHSMLDLEQQFIQEQAARERLGKENGDLQRRINQLMAEYNKIATYEERIAMQIQQIRRLSEVTITLRGEIGHLQGQVMDRDRLQEDFHRIQKQLSDLKGVMAQQDLTRKAVNERMNDQTRKCNQYQKLVNELSGEVQRLNEVLKAKIQENTFLENRCQQIKTENQQLHIAVESDEENRAKMDDYQNKFALISLEIQRLNAGLKTKVEEKNELDRELQLVRRDNEQLKRQGGDINQLKRENEDLRRQISDINHLRGENADIRRQLQSNVKAVQIGQERLEQCRHELRARIDEFETANRGYERRVEDYTTEIQRLNQILKIKLDQLREKDGEVRRLLAVNTELNSKVQMNKNKSKEVSDLERLNNLLRLKVEQAARWQNSNHELIRRTEGLQGNLDRAGKQNQRLHGQLQESVQENTRIMREVEGYKSKVANILKEVERLQQLLQTLRRENTDLKQQLSGGNLREKNQRLLQEIQRLKRVIDQQNGQLQELRLILTQDYSLDKRIKEQLSLIVILFAEIESLRKRVKDKDQEIEQVRRESLVPLKA